MQIELLEPGLAVPKGRGYVGVGGAQDTIFFPHIDSCLGIVGIFEDGTIIGGHAGAQWPGTSRVDYAFSGNRIFTLMDANRNRVKPGDLKTMVFVYPRSSGSWSSVATTIWKVWNPMAALQINTDLATKGANVLVTHQQVMVEDCASKRTVEYAVPYDEYEFVDKDF